MKFGFSCISQAVHFTITYLSSIIFFPLQKPRAWNLPAIQAWFQTLIGAKDFIHLIYCITLVTSQLHFKCELLEFVVLLTS